MKERAEQGHADAQAYLGYCYDVGKGVTQDYAQAVYWYQKAAEQGNVAALKNLGLCYEYGKGVLVIMQKPYLVIRKQPSWVMPGHSLC